ncbi:MAG: hypothetical protein E7053_06330 [Lentisphaerae bacterium]|nr:hypothetical protein [Lentisphaerota bacterium]
MMEKFLPGMDRFSVGVNYWASHAGIKMWREFSLEEIDRDFAALHAAGVNTVRLFPLWSDFQPVMWAAGSSNRPLELVFTDGTPLPEKGIRRYGLDPVMMERFRQVADLALKYDFRLIVGLLTGWMSGGFFAPPIMANKNVGNDFTALRIEKMFIDGFVSAMKDHPAIAAWEPGNECNCMAPFTPEESWHWMAYITSAIRLADPPRPVYSGMHSGKNYTDKPFSLMVQGEFSDALTTHPYPVFTQHCGRSALNNTPAVYHATAETLMYRGIGKKPAFVEEIGSFGNGYISDERSEKYLYTVLYSALVHGFGSVLWWCGFSFGRCGSQYPYRWIAMERALGAWNSDRSIAGPGRAMKKFQDELHEMPFGVLPPREVDAVVAITSLKDMWKTAYGTFILSKEAGFEIEYCNMDTIDALPQSNFYIVPSVSGYEVMDLHKYQLLLQAAENGATVVVSADNGMLEPFEEFFGCTVEYSAELPEKLSFTIDGRNYTFNAGFTRRIKVSGADVVAVLDDGTPLITRKKYGKGQLIYVSAALENEALTPGNNFYHIYRKLAQLAGVDTPEKSPEIGITRHILDDGSVVKFFINYSDHEVDGMAGNTIRWHRS